MYDDIEQAVEELKSKGVEFNKPIRDEGFGLVTWTKIPGGELALYEPKHPSPVAPQAGRS